MINSTAIELVIETIEGELLVDSNLIADCLGIEHKNFLATIEKYQTEIEQDFGEVAFETRPNKYRGIDSRTALLTEDQALCIMTYSRNTDQVRAAKRSLVKSFSAAKKLLQPDPTALERLTAQIALAFEKDVYRPWRKVNPEADSKFRSLVALPEILLAIEPSQTALVPNTDSLLRLIDTLSLTANRAGLAGNKSTKEAEFLDKQLEKIRPQILALQADRDRLQSEKDKFYDILKITFRIGLRHKTKNDWLFSTIKKYNQSFWRNIDSKTSKTELLKIMRTYEQFIDNMLTLYIQKTPVD